MKPKMLEFENERDKKKSKSAFTQNVLMFFREYCSCTSVHGFRYLGEQRTIFELVWWLMVFIICISALTVTIYSVYVKWEQSPIIVTLASQATPIYKIPFPAVTICPHTKTDVNLFNYTDILNKFLKGQAITPDEANGFEYMSMICSTDENIEYNLTYLPEDVFEYFHKVQSIFPLVDCSYKGISLNCVDAFAPIITEDGVCYSFNTLPTSNIFKDNVKLFTNNTNSKIESGYWSAERGYPESDEIWTHPRRALTAGIQNGLTILLSALQKDKDYVCNDALQGFKIMIHDPLTLAAPSQDFFRVALDQSVVASVQPNMMDTSIKVKQYDVAKRQCYFADERDLKYFKSYNKENCQIECLSNFTELFCDCVNFYMPRDNEIKICGANKTECMNEADMIAQAKDLLTKLTYKKLKDLIDDIPDCNCLPACTSLTYNVEMSQSEWDWKKWYSVRSDFTLEDIDAVHLSSLTIYFKTDTFTPTIRSELYGPLDFLANFGGLLGLFTGFSFLSLMEIIYFLTIRTCCNKKLYGHWAGKKTE